MKSDTPVKTPVSLRCVLQGICGHDHSHLIKSYILTQGNPKELRTMGEALSFLPSTAMYKDRR